MADDTSEFFDRISQPSAQPPMGNLTATIRIDLDRGKATEHWFLSVDNGTISASNKNVKADAVMHTDKELFDRLARGEANAMASVLRGLISFEGNQALLIRLQRLFPGPPTSRAPRTSQEAQPA